MICNDRIHSNPENTVGVLSMAGKGCVLFSLTFRCCTFKRPLISQPHPPHPRYTHTMFRSVEMLVSPTGDSTKIMAAFAKVTIGGDNSFLTSIQVAMLALKHRKNKVRILHFSARHISPRHSIHTHAHLYFSLTLVPQTHTHSHNTPHSSRSQAGGQRIIAFVGSPLTDDVDSLTKVCPRSCSRLLGPAK